MIELELEPKEKTTSSATVETELPSPPAPGDDQGAPEPAAAPKKVAAKKTPARKKPGRPKKGAANSKPSRDPDLAVGLRVKEPADPYARIKTLHAKTAEAVKQIRDEHPNTNIGDPVNPLDAGPRVLDEPILPSEIAGRAIMSLYEVTAALLHVEKIPDEKSFLKVGDSWAEASKFWGGSTSPANVALISAIVSTAMVFLPLTTAALPKKEKHGGDDEAN